MRFGLIIPNRLAMKKPYYLLVLIVYFSSCAVPKPYHQRINYIPTSGPNFGVEVLAENQIPPKPYFEVIDFDLSHKGRLSHMEAKKTLEMEAIKEGLDAVIMLDYWKGYQEEENLLTFIIDVLDEDQENVVMDVPYTYVRGIGIKYLDNIDYLNNHPEFEYVYKIDEETDLPSPYFKIEFNPTGQEHMIYPEMDEAQEVYSNYFQFYSDFHLIYQRDGWYYRKAQHRLKKRILINDKGLVAKTCKFTYDEQNRISEIVVNKTGRGYATVNYRYDEDGKKISKSIITADRVRIFEQYNYINGKLDGRKIRIIDPGKIKLSLNTTIMYYDPDFLKDFYEQEQQSNQEMTKSK